MHTKHEFRKIQGYWPLADSAADAEQRVEEAEAEVLKVLVELGDCSGPANTVYALTGAGGGSLLPDPDSDLVMTSQTLKDVVEALGEVATLHRRLVEAQGRWGRAVLDRSCWQRMEAMVTS